MKKKPNIILFITHDQGQLIGCYDSPQMPNTLNTPNIDNLAKEGVQFKSNFCTAPQCSPSRGSIMTSLYPHQNGLMGLVNLGWTLPETNKTLPMFLRDNGYTTYLVGLQHESRDNSTLGYDLIIPQRFRNVLSLRRMKRDIPDFFDKLKQQKEPFYACIGTFGSHIPYKGWGEPVDPDSIKVPPFLPDDEDIRMDFAELYGNIHTVDDLVGQVLGHLEDADLRDNTIFIYTTDHGIAFPRAKCTLYDPGIKTTFIMTLPESDVLTGGRIIDSMISNIDLLPSVLELIGAEVPTNIEGRSFLPILTGKTNKIRSEIFVEKTYHDIYDPMRGIRTENYKYIKNFEKSDVLFEIPEDMRNTARCGGVFMNKYPELYEKERMPEELYDLENDPNETNNVINDPDYKVIVAELKTKLNTWMTQTNDPLLAGRIKHPSEN
jgi:N-sulfoglucosamine sulfohydrolase